MAIPLWGSGRNGLCWIDLLMWVEVRPLGAMCPDYEGATLDQSKPTFGSGFS